jgi:hypothetical protein
MLVGAMLAWEPAAAQESPPPAVSPGLPNIAPLALPRPADTGKPIVFAPPLEAVPSSACAAVLGCRLRLNGVVQKNGAVELNATVFKW